MKKLSVAQFKKHVKSIKTPPGFTAEFQTKTWSGSKKDSYLVFALLKADDTEILFDQSGCGHTRFKVDGGWRSFDRTGVEDSFYHLPLYDKHKIEDLNAVVAEQLARIAKRREYFKSAVSIPGIPFTVAPDGVEKLKSDLAKRGRISFHPSGFGTGYEVTKRPTRGCRYGESRAKPEMEKFFGIAPLYVATMDCD